MNPILRGILGALAGLVVAFVVVSAIQVVSFVLYPPPADLDFSNHEAVKAHIATMPNTAFFLVLASWLAGPLAGTFVASLISRQRLVMAIIVGALFCLSSVYNLNAIPHPDWMWLPGVLAGPVGAIVGAAITPRGRARPAAA